MSDQFICDVLSGHPPLQEKEPLTGYCTRIGQIMRVSSIYGITQLLFPESDPRLIQQLADFPPLSVSTMAIATHQSKERILESTFYYIGVNFNRTTHPQAISRFLRGATYPFLRFCPICISENNYYSMFWRFIHIKGCEKHGCKLIECCPHCGCSIPLLCAPFKIGECPKCKGDLSAGKIEFLPREEKIDNISLVEDLRLFLSPVAFPKNLFVGSLIKLYRLQCNISLIDIANKLGVRYSVLSNAEHSHKSINGTIKFLDHISYIKALGISFHQIIKMPYLLNEPDNSIVIPVNIYKNFESHCHKPKKEKDENAASNYLDIKLPTISKRQEYEELKIKVEEAIDKLKDRGEEPSVKKIAEELGISKSAFYRYPEIRLLFPTRNDTIYSNHKVREAELLEKIDLFSNDLLHQNNPITYSLVSKLIDVPLDTLLYYYRVCEKLDELKYQQKTLWENGLITKLERFITSGLYNRPLTVKSILASLGLRDYQGKKFPRLIAMVREMVKEHKKERIIKENYGASTKKLTIVNSAKKEISVFLEKSKGK